MTLHMFTDGTETYIAESVEDAILEWEKFCGEVRDPDEYDEFVMQDDEQEINLLVEFDEFRPTDPMYPPNAAMRRSGEYFIVTALAREWCISNGRGFFSSTEY